VVELLSKLSNIMRNVFTIFIMEVLFFDIREEVPRRDVDLVSEKWGCLIIFIRTNNSLRFIYIICEYY